MKAICLRVDTGLIVAGVLLLAAIVAPPTAIAAPDDLHAAMEAYGKGDYETALTKLRAYVESNPDDEEVVAIINETENRLIIRALAQGGEHERLVKYLMAKSKPLEGDRLDGDAAASVAKEAVESSDLRTQRSARAHLRSAGELAVPHLHGYLASDDPDTVVNAILALRQLHGDAVEPLIAVLESENPRVRAYAVTVLGDIRDPRALPAVARVATMDDDPAAQEKGQRALAKLGGLEGSVADAYVRLGYRYYSRDVSVVRAFDSVKNVWAWEDGGLVRYEAPSYLYPFLMAEASGRTALTIDPGHLGARALLVRALLAQRVEGEVLTANGGEAPGGLDGAFDLAVSQGFSAATAALAGALEDEDWDVAVESAYLVAATYGGEDLAGHALGHALAAPQRRVRYAAAIAALRMSPKRGMPNADKVVSLGAQAASESAIRQALVIDDDEATRNKVLMALAHGGIQASSAPRGTFGVMRAKRAPSLDVIIVRADLGSRETVASAAHSSSYMVIDELLADARTKDMKIVVLVQDTPENQAAAIREGFQKKYGEDIHGFIEVPVVEANAFSTVKAAAEGKDLNPDRERANALAVTAAEAFAKVDFSCRSFDLTVAVEPLSTAATTGPTPEIRMAATRALGNLRVGGGDALLEVLQKGESPELQAAAATALGRVLSAVDGTPEQIEGLMAASEEDDPVGSAALAALGQVRNLTPQQRLKIYEAHRLGIPSKP